jgi:hypothetical protein
MQRDGAARWNLGFTGKPVLEHLPSGQAIANVDCHSNVWSEDRMTARRGAQPAAWSASAIRDQGEEPLRVARPGQVVEHDVRRGPAVDLVPKPAQLVIGVDVP